MAWTGCDDTWTELMADPTPTFFTDAELVMLAALRSLQADDRQLESPPAEIWAGISRAVTDVSGDDDSHRIAPNRRRWWIAGAAAVAVLATGLATSMVLRSGDETTVVASAELTSEGLAGAPSGLRVDAEVVESNASEVLRIDIGQLGPASGEYLEVWLMKADISGMVSLGTVRPDGTYEVPAGLSLSMYPVVDVSSEPYDGDPTHAGSSLLRGQLEGPNI